MDETKKKDICGETKEFGRQKFICAREPHANISRKRRYNHRDGVYFFGEPPANSHRMVNINSI